EAYLNELETLPARERKRFLLGEFGSDAENPLWTNELLDQCRIRNASDLPDYQRIVIAVDPSGGSGPADKRSDEVGIVVAALGTDQRGYIIEDLSGRHGPREWGNMVAAAYERHGADVIVAETNFGGAMVQQVIEGAKPGLHYKEVKASRGKVVRAEPIAVLFEQ